MTFCRLDELIPQGDTQVSIVRYQAMHVVTPFEINATKDGVVIMGTTPRVTDYVKINQVFGWAQQQAASLKQSSKIIPQHILDQSYVSGIFV